MQIINSGYQLSSDTCTSATASLAFFRSQDVFVLASITEVLSLHDYRIHHMYSCKSIHYPPVPSLNCPLIISKRGVIQQYLRMGGLLAIIITRPGPERPSPRCWTSRRPSSKIGIIAITIETPIRLGSEIHVIRRGAVVQTPREVWDRDASGGSTDDGGSTA